MKKEEGSQGNSEVGGELDQKKVNSMHSATLLRAQNKMKNKGIVPAKLQIVS